MSPIILIKQDSRWHLFSLHYGDYGMLFGLYFDSFNSFNELTFFVIKTYVDGLFSVQIISILRWGLSQNKLLNKVILLSVSG